MKILRIMFIAWAILSVKICFADSQTTAFKVGVVSQAIPSASNQVPQPDRRRTAGAAMIMKTDKIIDDGTIPEIAPGTTKIDFNSNVEEIKLSEDQTDLTVTQISE